MATAKVWRLDDGGRAICVSVSAVVALNHDAATLVVGVSMANGQTIKLTGVDGPSFEAMATQWHQALQEAQGRLFDADSLAPREVLPGGFVMPPRLFDDEGRSVDETRNYGRDRANGAAINLAAGGR